MLCVWRLPCLVLLQMTECALSMLTALAEEVHNMDKARRQEIVAATSSQWADIAALAQTYIPEQMAAGACGRREAGLGRCFCQKH